MTRLGLRLGLADRCGTTISESEDSDSSVIPEAFSLYAHNSFSKASPSLHDLTVFAEITHTLAS